MVCVEKLAFSFKIIPLSIFTTFCGFFLTGEMEVGTGISACEGPGEATH